MIRFFRAPRLLMVAGLAVAAYACGDEEPSPQPVQTAPIAQQQQPQQQQQAQPQPAGSMASNFGTVALEAGFVPDPHVVNGTSGGGVDAATLSPGCSGWVSSTPDHVLDARSAFAPLRILAHSTGDVTLVVQKPDGSYVCNDDAEGTDPVIEAQLSAGAHRIWVGSYEQGASAQYRLGFSELGSTRAASL